MTQYIKETLHRDWGQFFDDYTVICEQRTAQQKLLLIETRSFGRVLILDDVVQTTEKDNFVYHELLTHVPILAHGKCRSVLVIGGGDGGTAREALKHPDTSVTLVEIDRDVINFSQKYLPDLSEGAFESDRLRIVIDDGCKFVSETAEKFDVVIVDSTDPIGPGRVLFTKEFYTGCKRVLTDGGILVTQNGVPFTQEDDLRTSVRYFNDLFSVGTCYLGTVPTYVGGPMAFGFATDNINAYSPNIDTLKARFEAVKMQTKYYNPETHKAAFVLPNYVKDILEVGL